MIPKTKRLQEYRRLQVVSYGIDYVAGPLLLFFSFENLLLSFRINDAIKVTLFDVISNIRHKSRHEVYSKLNIRSVQSINFDKQNRYAYLEEVVVTRTNEKECKIAKADFPNLNQNDFEDLYMLKIQNKIHTIKGIEEYDLINALNMYIYRTVIKKRVKDVQMGSSRGVVYEGVANRKRLMRADELHKFCDGTLNKVLNKLEVILRNNRLGYNNEGMEKYEWTAEDKNKTLKFMDKIEKTLKERGRFRRLKLFVGGRRDKIYYYLLVRPE
uniref:Uncharacterized protein n=1 Tax=Tanacetum cinerariifolium TaxID=118510 RepID=A0A6L2L732_TANCI|nr:hypothetical protein [Tanacetum cinerariifolium]